MGLLFTILYIITAYLAPVTIFGDLANYHVEILIVSLALIFSLFSMSGSNVMKLPQTWAIFGLCIAVTLSVMVNGWLGGGPKALIEFVPEVTTFFLIVMNCKKKWHLQALALTLFFCAAFTIRQAMYDLSIMNRQSDYLLGQRVGDDLATWLIRIRGRSFLGDPNDFAQFMVSLIPIMFLFWVKGATLRNFFLVYVPSGVLLFGMFETHSRGSMVALMIMCIVALRRRIGLVRSVVIGMALFAGLSAVGYSGGRDVSAGDDRVAAWAGGLMLIRSHPIFGVGFNRFSDFYEITAHNTFVVCAAELGLVGAFFWVLLMYVTVRNSLETEKDPNQKEIDENKKLDAFHAKQPFLQGIPNFTEVAMTPATVAGSAPISSQSHRYPGSPFVLPPDLVVDSANHVGANYLGVTNGEEDKEAQDAEIRRMAGLMTISFAAFLTAGWFLSRSYTMCLYVNAGFAAAVYRMAQDRGIAPPQLTFGEAAKMSAKIIFLLLAIVWIIVHTDHYLPH